MSIRPNRRITSANAETTPLSLVQSNSITKPLLPIALMSSSICLTSALVSMATTASAPSRARRNAVAPPMPPAAAVTTATLPFRRPGQELNDWSFIPNQASHFYSMFGSLRGKDPSGSGVPTQGLASGHRKSKLFDRELACHLSTERISRLDRIIVFLAVLELPANEVEAHHVAVSVGFPICHRQVAPPLDKDT